MTGRPGQTRPLLAKEKENEENISLAEERRKEKDIAEAKANKSRYQRKILNDFAWQSVPSHLHL